MVSEANTKNKIRAQFTEDTITVYQAYSPHIANAAVAAQTFVAPFKMNRMTWIKPSFLWMMYRSGWASKPNQECILAVEISRAGFEWALQHSCLSHYQAGVHQSHEEWKSSLQKTPVRIQWDPEKNLFLEPLPYRSIQIGISGSAVQHYVNEWITGIQDITDTCKQIRELVIARNLEAAQQLLPTETVYPIPDSIKPVLGIT